MHHRRRRDGHLRHDLGMGLEKLEVLEHRVVGESDLAHDAQALRLGLHAAELDALVALVQSRRRPACRRNRSATRSGETRRRWRACKPELLLLPDDLLDLAVLDRLELGRRDHALFALGARLLERRGAQEAADMIGAERRLGSFIDGSSDNLARAKARPPRRVNHKTTANCPGLARCRKQPVARAKASAPAGLGAHASRRACGTGPNGRGCGPAVLTRSRRAVPPARRAPCAAGR